MSGRVVDVDRTTFQAVMQLLGEHPELDVDQVRAMVEQPPSRRRPAEPIRPRTAGDLVALVQAGVITKAEAKRYLRVPRARASAHSKGGLNA